MFEFLSMFARWPFSRGTDSPSRFRKLETARGCYFVPWQPEVIKSLLATENLSSIGIQERHPLYAAGGSGRGRRD